MQKQIILKTSPHPSFGTGAVVTDRAGTTLGIAEAGFLAALQRIIAAARRLPDNLVLLGLTRTVRKGGNDPFTQRCKESSLDSMRRRAISRAAEQPSSRAAEQPS